MDANSTGSAPIPTGSGPHSTVSTPIPTGAARSAPGSEPLKPTVEAMAKARVRRDTASVCRALGSAIRMRALRRLMEVGLPMSVSQLASRERLSRDAMGRHLDLMERAGVLSSHPGVDRRTVCYFVPAEYRAADGALDFGCCVVRLEGY